MKILFLLIFWMTLITSVNTYGGERVKSVHIAFIVDTTSRLYKCANEYFQSIFNGIPSYEIEIVPLPANRILLTLKSNPNFIGDLGRSKPYAEIHPDYYKILLPVKIGVVCVSKKYSPAEKCDIETVKKSKITTARGNLLVKVFLNKYKLKPTLEHKIISQGLLQLDHNRADVMLIGHDQYLLDESLAKKYRINELVKLEETYTFIKPEYKDLAKSIEREVRKNKKAEMRLKRCLRN